MRPLAFADNIQNCFSRPFKMGSQAKCEISLKQRQDIKTLFKPLKAYFAKSNPKVIFFDQNDLFCDSEKCSMVRNGMPLMRDAVHISEYASIEVSKIFEKWAKKHVPEMLG